jgi:D-arabinose 1-dehydrogenase-like Zn-dependent alcohol dehydrogenase
MNVFQKLLNSSTAWLGALTAGATAYSQTTATPINPTVAAILVGGYALKEMAAKIAEARQYAADVAAQAHADALNLAASSTPDRTPSDVPTGSQGWRVLKNPNEAPK